MKTLKFEIEINASVDKVYQKLIDKEGYSLWTKAFNAKSRFEGNWSKGSEILFIGCNEDGSEAGMVSIIEDNIPNSFISIMHLGLYKEGKKIMSGKDVDHWVGGLENYQFIDMNGKTKLEVEMDAVEDFQSYFNATFPKALILLKELCEKD